MVNKTSAMVSDLLAKVGDDSEKRSGILSQSIQAFTETRIVGEFFEKW